MTADFEHRLLHGTATLLIQRSESAGNRLVLDTRDLLIHSAEISSDGASFFPADFETGAADPVLGAPLKIQARRDTSHVRIAYSTQPQASGLQWLNPEQTATKQYPFLFTQSEEIHARSWMPIQDTPGVRVTFSAHIQVPHDLVAVMGAERLRSDPEKGIYEFRMQQSVPAYLIALAVGRLQFAETGPRSGVFAEPPLLADAAAEFVDAEHMLTEIEALYGPYRWGRFDILVLPPSFPFGGMENPRVPFITPTLIAGDKSLVSLITHELAHSWSGNLVTNATWGDFWLNEGFTTYIEHRIQERLYGTRRAEMEMALEREALDKELPTLPLTDQILNIDLTGRDPDEGSTQVPYVKGALFLLTLERLFGRKRLDDFLRDYFEKFAFQSITTAQAMDYLDERLLSRNPVLARQISITEWVNEPGLPAGAPRITASAFDDVERTASEWLDRKISTPDLRLGTWSVPEVLHFLSVLPKDIGPLRLRELDDVFRLTNTRNCEVLERWLVLAVRNDYAPVFPKLEEFLASVGRRKYLKALYTELARTPEKKQLAERIYSRSRVGYHSITRSAIDRVLHYEPARLSP